METAVPAPKGTRAKQTIRMLFHRDTWITSSSKMKFLGDNWFFNVKRADSKIIFTIRRDYIVETLPYSVTYELRLLGLMGDCVSRRGKISDTIGGTNGRYGAMIEQNKVFDFYLSQKFFDAKNNMTIELDLSVKEQAEDLCAKQYRLFSQNSTFASDCVILIEGNKIYVDKKFLSMHSAPFKAMFESGFMENKQSEIEFTDVDFNEFIELLSVVYPTGQFISVSNVRCLLKLADRYIMSGVLRQCEQFLMLESNMDNLEKLILAQKYHLIHLQEHCASQFQRFDEIKKLENDGEYADLNERTKSIMLDSLICSNSTLE